MRRSVLLVPVSGGGLWSVRSGGVRWVCGFTDEVALARFARSRTGGDQPMEYAALLGARIVDEVVPSLDEPAGLAVDIATEDGSMFFPPVVGIVPVAEFEHDAQLHLTRVTNPQGLTWDYEYDAAGDIVSETDFDGRTLTCRMDAGGQLAARTDALGGTIAFERDELGQVIRKDVDGRVTTYAHDRAGRLLEAAGPDSELRYQYDRRGRVKTELVDGRATSYAYDALGRRKRAPVRSGEQERQSGRSARGRAGGLPPGGDRGPLPRPGGHRAHLSARPRRPRRAVGGPHRDRPGRRAPRPARHRRRLEPDRPGPVPDQRIRRSRPGSRRPGHSAAVHREPESDHLAAARRCAAPGPVGQALRAQREDRHRADAFLALIGDLYEEYGGR